MITKKDIIDSLKIAFVITILLIITLCLSSIRVKADCTSLNNAEWYVSFDNLNGNDDSGNGHNPTSYNNTFTATDCKLGKCADFSGVQQYIEYDDFLDGWNNFTFAFWAKRDVDSAGYERIISKTGNTDYDYDYVIQIETADKIQNIMHNQLGVMQSTVDTNAIKVGGWNHYVVTWDGVNVRIFINGTLKTKAAKTLSTLYNDVSKWNFGRMYAGAYYYGFNGRIDEVWVKRTNLSETQINLLFNSGLGCNPYNGTVADTTPPTITFSSQTPSNLTAINGMQIGLKINYTITDSTAVNTSKVKMNMTVNNSNQWIDGKKYPLVFTNVKYTVNSGSNFNWAWDDNQIYNSYFVVNHTLQERQTNIQAFTLTQANDWFKTTFKNLSNKVQYSLIEGMTENATTTLCSLQIYYCNSSYITGNPISSKNCGLFFEGINNNAFNHTHGNGRLKDKIYSMPITNGKIANVGVTPTSHILYRGSNICNQKIFYTNQSHSTGIVQTTNNNGNTYTNQDAIAPILHLHQILNNMSVNYQISACDTLNNCGKSSKRSDKIDLISLFPSSPHITFPTSGNYLSTVPITITYLACVSPTNLNINRYLIQYMPSGSSTLTTIVSNNYPSLSYFWAISAIPTGDYNIKVTCFDILNQSSFSTSETFRITSMTDLLLTNINNTMTNTYNLQNTAINDFKSFYTEVSNMYVWLILFVLTIILGVFTINKFAFILSGFFWFIINLMLYNQTNINVLYLTVYKYIILVFLIFGTLGLIALGITLELREQIKVKKEHEESYKY